MKDGHRQPFGCTDPNKYVAKADASAGHHQHTPENLLVGVLSGKKTEFGQEQQAYFG